MINPLKHLILAAGILLLLFLVPAASALCPDNCECINSSMAKSPGYSFCGGKQVLCGYEKTLTAQVPQYCYQKPQTTPEIVKCPLPCMCLASSDAIAKGYSSCQQEKRPCGYDATQNLKYCYAEPATTTVTTTMPTGTPDLVINDVYTDSWGAFREVRYIIQNRGDGVARPSTTRLTIDGVSVGEDAVAALYPGEFRVETFSYSGVCTGSSDLFGATADSSGAVAESDETNNARQREYTCPIAVRRPDFDLAVVRHEGEANFSYTTRAYTAPENIRFLVKSTGSGDSPPSEARLYVDGTWVSTTSIPAMTSGGGFEGGFGYSGICSGISDSIRVVVDPSDLVNEEDETNNEKSAVWNCTVTPSPDNLPDLIIRRIWLTPLPDYQFKISYEIQNQGRGWAPFTRTGLRIDDMYRIQDGVDRLAPGEFRNEEFWWNYSMRECTGRMDNLGIMADYEGRVTETVETNNEFEQSMNCTIIPTTVTPKPDLVIRSVWYECTPPCDEYVIKYTILNQGSAAATASESSLNINYHDLGASPVPALGPGTSVSQTFHDPWTPAYPDNHIQVCADRGNRVDEMSPPPSGEVNNCLENDWRFNFTCDDNIQNRDEEGVDCGGSYCPPCSRCATGAKWAPSDTPCTRVWPTDEGPVIGMNTEDDSCAIIEVCHPELDYIIQDAITCAEHADFATRYTGSRASDKACACSLARAESGIDTSYNPSTYKRSLATYLIYGLGSCHAYMQGYFAGEFCCAGYDPLCPDTCPYWSVKPSAWEMGTASSCSGDADARPDFQMGGHRCEYYDAWIFGKYGKPGYWNSDSDYRSNSDSVVDVPAHASINRLSTGTCVDYSFALTTLLRKAGYSKDDIFSVNGESHGYNLLRFPGEDKFHYVDTVGNRGNEVLGGTGYPDIYNASGYRVAWYDYCTKMEEGCSNDNYGQSTGRCPSNNQIYSCEGIRR
jgi:subtilase family serine protease